MITHFRLTAEQNTRIKEWLDKEIYPAVVKDQRKHFVNPTPFHKQSWDAGFPYEGASGGGLTYEFTPTSIGIVEKVRYGAYTLDLTEYDSW